MPFVSAVHEANVFAHVAVTSLRGGARDEREKASDPTSGQ